MQAIDVFSLLQGKWALSRTVSGSACAMFLGEGSFTLLKRNLLCYHEEGVLKVNGQKLFAYKEYYYLLRGTQIFVFFDPGCTHLFHKINLAKRAKDGFIGKGEHLCVRDFYKMFYFLENCRQLKTECLVQGPLKNYLIATFYKKSF